jgi:hypothetical protein
MPSRFIELQIDNIDEKEVINFDLVRRFYRRPGTNYTIVEFPDANSITVKETPAQIAEILARRG